MSLRELRERSNIRIHNGVNWDTLSKVKGKADTPGSCIVQTENEKELRRNMTYY